jgi:hypothetical protein
MIFLSLPDTAFLFRYDGRCKDLTEYSRRFLRQYGQLPNDIPAKADDRLKLFSQGPLHPLLKNHSLKEPCAGCRSINIA